MRVTKIYVLRDPRTGEIRYVGKTIRTLEYRLAGHIYGSAKQRTHRDRWIFNLLSLGLRPQIEEIDATVEDWAEREAFWIRFHRGAGADLTNHTDGGEGAPGNVHPESTRKKLSDRMKLVAADPVWRARRSKIMKAKFSSPEWHAAHLVLARAGWTQEKRTAASARIKGTKWTERQRIAAKRPPRNAQEREIYSTQQRRAWTPELREAHRKQAIDRLAIKPIEWTEQRRADQSARARKTLSEKPIIWTDEMRAAAAVRIRANPPQREWTDERRKAQGERIRARNLARSAKNKASVNEEPPVSGAATI